MQLNAEVKESQNKLSEIGVVKSAYNSDKRAYSEALTNLKSTNDTLQEEFELVSSKLRIVEKEKQQLVQDIDFKNERIQLMERNFDSNKHVIQRLNNEKEEEIGGQR